MSRAPDEPLDALKLAAVSAVVERGYRIADFARLADRLATSDGDVEARVAFRTSDGVSTGELQVRAQAMLICQRCLGPMLRTLESTSRLAFVESEEIAVPADHEVIAGDPRRVDLAALIEDELLLSLPLAAMHPGSEPCAARQSRAMNAEGVKPPTLEKRRPFAGLKDLLKH